MTEARRTECVLVGLPKTIHIVLKYTKLERANPMLRHSNQKRSLKRHRALKPSRRNHHHLKEMVQLCICGGLDFLCFRLITPHSPCLSAR
jgi:ribosomal protein L35